MTDGTRAYASKASRRVLLVRNRPLGRQPGGFLGSPRSMTRAIRRGFYQYTLEPTADR